MSTLHILCSASSSKRLASSWAGISACLLTLALHPCHCRAGEATPARATMPGDQAEATAQVAAATTPAEKVKALYARACLVNGIKSPIHADWDLAAIDLREAVGLITKIEADGKTQVAGQAEIYFQQGFVAGRLQEYQVSIAAYDRAEKLGYLDHMAATALKGSELLANRALAKSALYDYNGALADDNAALALKDYAVWHQRLAEDHFALGDCAAAVAAWNRARALDPAIKEPAFDPALAPYNKAVAANPGAVTPFIARAHFLLTQAETLDPGWQPRDATNPFSQFIGPPTAAKAYKLEPALVDLNRAVALQPGAALPLLERGRLRLVYMSVQNAFFDRSFDFVGTQMDLMGAVRLEPKNAEAWYELGLAELAVAETNQDTVVAKPKTVEQKSADRQSVLQSAAEDFSHAIYLQPSASGEAHLRRALAESQLPRPDYNILLTDYTAAIDQGLSPTDAAWSGLLGRVPATDALVTAHLARSRLLTVRGHYDAALADLTATLKLDDKSLDAHFERGRLLTQRGDYPGAIQDMTAVIAVRPDAPEAWLWRGVALDGAGQTDQARADLKQAITLKPALAGFLTGSRYAERNPDPNRGIAPSPQKTDLALQVPGAAADHLAAGDALAAKGDADGALLEDHMALMLDGHLAAAFLARGAIYGQWGAFDLALPDLDAAIQALPSSDHAYLARAKIWTKLGEFAFERRDLDKALELATTDAMRADVFWRSAAWRQKQGDWATANAECGRAIKMDATNPLAWKENGDLQAAANNLPGAVSAYRKSLELAPEASGTRLALAIAFARQNDEHANDELKRSLKDYTPASLAIARGTINDAAVAFPGSIGLEDLKRQAAKIGVPDDEEWG